MLKLPPALPRNSQPILFLKRPPKARSTTTWSYSAKACERGSACSLVKPCGIISLSKAGVGDGPVARLFSLRAVFSQFMVYMVSNWGLWQPPQTAGSVLVTGRVFSLAMWSASLSWQEEQASVLCLPSVWKALIGSWHFRQAVASSAAAFRALAEGAGALLLSTPGVLLAAAGAADAGAASQTAAASPINAAIRRAGDVFLVGNMDSSCEQVFAQEPSLAKQRRTRPE